MSPTANTSGCPGSGEVGEHRRCVRPGRARPRSLRRAWRRAATPARRPPRSSCGPRSATCCRRRRRRRRRTRRRRRPGRPSAARRRARSQLLGRLAGEPIAERGQRLLAAVEQQHPHRRRIERAELALEAADRQLAHLSGQLDAGRTGADDDHGQPLLAARPGRSLDSRHLEGAEDPPAQLQGVVDRLHARRVAGQLVVTEVRLVDAGGDDEAVVGELEVAEVGGGGGVDDPADRGRSRSPRRARRGRSRSAARRGGSAGRSGPARACPSPPGTAAAGTGGGCAGRPG